MPAWICMRCAVQYPDTSAPPPSCPICNDEREAVPPSGQRWTDPVELRREHRTEIRAEEPGLIGVGVTPEFGIASAPCSCAPMRATCCGTASPCSTRRAAARSTTSAG